MKKVTLLFIKKLLVKIWVLLCLKNKRQLKTIKNQITSILYRRCNTHIKNKNQKQVFLIFNIQFSKSNIFINITDFFGNTKQLVSSGIVGFIGTEKLNTYALIRLYNYLVAQNKTLAINSIAVHYKNIKQNHNKLILKYIKSIFTVKDLKFYISSPYNGCRPKKIKRLKRKSSKRLLSG